MATDSIIYVNPVNSSGCCFGQNASDLIGFYGATPIEQRSGSSQAEVSTASTANLQVLVNEIRLTLIALGLMKGA